MFEKLENELGIVERHLRVLAAVEESEPVGLVTLTNRLAYPRHKIRYSLRVLEAEDLLESTANGVTTTDRVAAFRDEAVRRFTALEPRVAGLRMTSPPGALATTGSASAD